MQPLCMQVKGCVLTPTSDALDRDGAGKDSCEYIQHTQWLI